MAQSNIICMKQEKIVTFFKILILQQQYFLKNIKSVQYRLNY